MSMLATSPELASKEFLEKISYPITLEKALINVLSLYPSKLKAFTLLNYENEVEILNFPFNPAVSPMEIMVQQALSQATNQNNLMTAQINNVFAMILMDNLYKNREAIEGEISLSMEDLLQRECKFIRKKDTGTSLLLADAQGDIDGDVIEIGIDLLKVS